MNTSGWNVWFAQLADPFNFEPQQPDLWHDKPSLPFGRSICQSCLAKGSSFAKDELHTWCCLMHKFLYILACTLSGWSSAPHELSVLNYVFFRLSSLQCQAKSCPPSTQEKHRHRLRRRRPCPLSNGYLALSRYRWLLRLLDLTGPQREMPFGRNWPKKLNDYNLY